MTEKWFNFWYRFQTISFVIVIILIIFCFVVVYAKAAETCYQVDTVGWEQRCDTIKEDRCILHLMNNGLWDTPDVTYFFRIECWDSVSILDSTPSGVFLTMEEWEELNRKATWGPVRFPNIKEIKVEPIEPDTVGSGFDTASTPVDWSKPILYYFDVSGIIEDMTNHTTSWMLALCPCHKCGGNK